MSNFVRRWAAFLLGPFVVLLGAVAQEPVTPTTVKLPTAWMVGDKVEITLEKSRTKTEGHTATKLGGSTSTAVVEVVERRDTGWLFRWTWGGTDVEAAKPGESTFLAEKLANLTKGLRVDLVMDRYGSVIDVENVDELVEMNKRVLAELEAALKEAGQPEGMVERVMQTVAPLTTPDAVKVSMSRDAGQLFNMNGGSFAIGETIVDKDKRANPLGGPAIDVEIRIGCDGVDEAENAAIIRQRQIFDPRQAAISMHAMAQQLRGEQGASAPAPEDLPKVEITDETVWTHDLRTGWPTECFHERVTRVGIRHQTTQSRFTLRILPRASESK